MDYIDEAALYNLKETLVQAGYPSFGENLVWENVLCAAIFALNPNCKIYTIIEALPYKKEKLDETDVFNTLVNLGFSSEKIESVNHKIKFDRRLLPCIFITRQEDPGFLFPMGEDHIGLYQNGMMKEVSTRSLGNMHTVWKLGKLDENRQPYSKYMRHWMKKSWFSSLISRFHSQFAHILLTGLFLNIIALCTPLLTMLIYDRIIASASYEKLGMIALGGIFCTAMELVFRSLRAQSLSWFASRTDNLVSNRIFSQLVGLPASMIENASVSSQIARIKAFESVRDFFNSAAFLSVIEIIYTPFALTAMWFIAGSLVFVPLCMTLLYGVIFAVTYRFVRVSIRISARASSIRQQFTIDTLERIKGIRAYGMTELWRKRFRELSGHEIMSNFHLGWAGTVAEICAQAVTLLTIVAVVGYGAHLIWNDSITTGALVASMIIVWRILTPFYTLCTMVPRLEQIKNSIIQVDKLMEMDNEKQAGKHLSRLTRISGHISFINVGFHYQENREEVLSSLMLDVKAGELVTVTGKNGSGKTTLLKIIKDLYPVSEGVVQLDGFDIRQLEEADLRRHIAYVPQMPDFYNGSIKDNIIISNPMAREEDVYEALKLADAMKEIEEMPKGIHTRLSRYGNNAPSLQLASKLSLARAYIHDAPILLIDELPNTLLCAKAGRNLKEYIGRVKGRKTVLIATYRQDYFDMADINITLHRSGLADIIKKEIKDKKEAA